MRNANSISIKDYGGGIRTAKRKTKWILGGNIPKSVDDLSFVGRDGDRFIWWNVTPPKTDYWHAFLGEPTPLNCSTCSTIQKQSTQNTFWFT